MSIITTSVSGSADLCDAMHTNIVPRTFSVGWPQVVVSSTSGSVRPMAATGANGSRAASPRLESTPSRAAPARPYCLSTVAGSIRVACSAGASAATSVTAVMKPVTARIVGQSVGPIPYSCSRSDASGGQCQRHAGGEADQGRGRAEAGRAHEDVPS